MEKKIALFDMDDTLCDYIGQLKRDLLEFYSPEIVEKVDLYHGRTAREVREKIREIRAREGWWRSLIPLGSGMELWDFMKSLGFENHILTKGPYNDDNAWKEKKQWKDFYLREAKNFTITEDKSGMRGDVLVDDFPLYVTNWLKRNENSVAILPVQPYNLDYRNPRAIISTGQNYGELEKFLAEHKLITYLGKVKA